jgi:anti-sigma regulatory factor (Ser/Thr protein kinase)
MDDAALAISELTTNAVLHARTECLVEADFADSHLVVCVSDGLAGDVPSSDGSREHFGRGLEIVASIADSWGVNQIDGGKMVWFSMVSKGH